MFVLRLAITLIMLREVSEEDAFKAFCPSPSYCR
jgi:hypothetical protein